MAESCRASLSGEGQTSPGGLTATEGDEASSEVGRRLLPTNVCPKHQSYQTIKLNQPTQF